MAKPEHADDEQVSSAVGAARRALGLYSFKSTQQWPGETILEDPAPEMGCC